MSNSVWNWHIVTPEYPPQIGGVGDYSRLVAEEFAARGEAVSVWYPGCDALPQGFSPEGLRALSRYLDAGARPRRIFVQWVPHGYGYRSMNVAFAFWLWRRAHSGDQIDLMVHEPFLPFREGSWKQDGAAVVHRAMILLALRAATHVWVSIPRWRPQLEKWQWGNRIPIEWLPVPSNVVPTGETDFSLRERFPADRPLIGHFGTYGKQILGVLEHQLPVLLEAGVNILLLGRDSDLVAASFNNRRILGLGTQDGPALSRSLAACDLLLQPYTDGISARRGSAMAAIAHGKALVTTRGPATESIWQRSQAVCLVPHDDLDALPQAVLGMIEDRGRLRQLGARARTLYEENFSVRLTVQRLLNRKGAAC